MTSAINHTEEAQKYIEDIGSKEVMKAAVSDFIRGIQGSVYGGIAEIFIEAAADEILQNPDSDIPKNLKGIFPREYIGAISDNLRTKLVFLGIISQE